MGANNGKQYGSDGKGSSSISSDVSSSTDHTPTKTQKNAATSEGQPVQQQIFGLFQKLESKTSITQRTEILPN